MSQSSRILDYLADGRVRSVREIHAACGFSRLNSRVAELRSRGHNIVCERVTGETGSDGFTYQLVGALEGVLHWGPLRDSLTKVEASDLIERLSRLEENVEAAA